LTICPDDCLALGDLALLLDLDGIPAITGCDLDTLVGVPGFSVCRSKPSATTC
jgi:hypothetical protein